MERVGFAGNTQDSNYPASHFALVADMVSKEKFQVEIHGEEFEDEELDSYKC